MGTMCVCMYVCVFVCVYMCVCECVCVYVSVCVCKLTVFLYLLLDVRPYEIPQSLN